MSGLDQDQAARIETKTIEAVSGQPAVNLRDRITEAQQQGWAGEAEGLKVSLAAATAKLTQMDELAARQATTVDLGMPAFTQTASRTITATAVLPVSQTT